MPKITDYQFTKLKRLNEKRNWKLWLDGKKRLFVQGEDFMTDPATFRSNAYRQASRHGINIASEILYGDPPSVVIQCINPISPEAWDKRVSGKRRFRLRWPKELSEQEARKIDREMIDNPALGALAVRTGISVADHIRKAVAEYLERQEGKPAAAELF
jgi:hypothetical protein